jgi:pyruvate,orthophosphate dikinase
MSKKLTYLFSEGDASMRNLLGGKGAGLAEMTKIGLPVPQGFTITTEACNGYYDDGKKLSEDLKAQIFAMVKELEKITGKEFGSVENPLLVSVRSGARASMPGMMDTILNLGINDEVAESIAAKTGNPRFAYDSYRRFVQMYSDVVMQVPKSEFEKHIDAIKEEKGVKLDSELEVDDLKRLVKEFKQVYTDNIHEEFPSDANTQLLGAVEAVFRSWNNERAIYYRKINDIPSSWGTAVNVQEMVFGNMGDGSGTGVAFTRNPATGENKVYGEYLLNAQGEDVVAGVRTPSHIDHLKEEMPAVYDEFVKICGILEDHYHNMQDLEYTIENGKLFILQCRNGKRTSQAALKIAVDMVNEGKITTDEAIMQVEPKQLDTLLHPYFDPEDLKAHTPIGRGLPASPGAACGQIVFDQKTAAEWAKDGKKVILVRLETSAEDVEGMHVSEGILTARGGMTSHAAVVARGMGTTCVAGCADLIFHGEDEVVIGSQTFHEGDWISLNGTTGEVYGTAIKTIPATIEGDFAKFMGWVDARRRMKVMMNADVKADIQRGLELGAEGIGLVRTEHMFFETKRIRAIREMIIAKDEAARKAALAKVLPLHQENFEEIFEVMGELPVTIRYLDPPLHEFLPKTAELQQQIADDLGVPVQEIADSVARLHEQNPMMGWRGCRLAVSYPEIAEMQTRAIIQAAVNVQKKTGKKVHAELMVPLVNLKKEFEFIYDVMKTTAEKVIEENGERVHYTIGTCMETPRSCLKAGEIAEKSEFFSYGTNDLTQLTFGFSRDDAGKFLNAYYDRGLLDADPFQSLDVEGVGELIKIGLERGRAQRPDLKIGICGEQASNANTIAFLDKIGFDYVSPSPYLVPMARLAEAQATIVNEKN